MSDTTGVSNQSGLDLQAQAESLCNELSSNLDALSVELNVNSFWNIFKLDDGVKSAVQSSLDQTRAKLIDLQPPNGQDWLQVAAGQMDFQTYQGIASAQKDLLVYSAQQLGVASPTFSNLFQQVAVPTVGTIDTAVRAVADKIDLPSIQTNLYVIAGVVIVVLILIAFIKLE